MCSKATEFSIWFGVHSPHLTLFSLEEVYTFLLLGLKCPIAVNFGALYSSRTSKNSKVFNAEPLNIFLARGLIIKSVLSVLNLLPLMCYYELSDIMFLVNSLKNQQNDLMFYDNYVKLQDLNTRSSARNNIEKHVLCVSNLQSISTELLTYGIKCHQ